MRKLVIFTSIIIFTGLLQSCLLTQEDAFVCEKNAPVKVNGVDKCAFAVGKFYRFDSTTPNEQLSIAFSYSGGSFQVNLHTSELEEGVTYNYPGDADLSFPELNKGGSGILTITVFDRTARTISGEFNMTAEGAANFTAYNYEVSGTFSEASF